MTNFDLRVVKNKPIVRKALVWSWATTGMLIVTLAGSVTAVVYVTLRGLWTSAIDVAWVGSVLFVAAVFVFIFIVSRPQATNMEVDKDKLTFYYAWRSPKIVNVADRRLKLLLMRGRDPQEQDPSQSATYIIFGLVPVRTYITQAAYEAVLSQALSLGLKIEEQPYQRPEWTYVSIGAAPQD